MRVLALDVSSRSGWALFDVEEGKPVSAPILKGLVELEENILTYGSGVYPDNYTAAAVEMARRLSLLAVGYTPDVVVIEETNLGKNRYSQKFLEFVHCCLIAQLRPRFLVKYISSSSWRSALGIALSKEDKKNNGRLSKAKRKAGEGGKVDKKALGVKGKIGKKHLSVRYVNETFGLSFKMKDNDIADAICLGAAYVAGAEICDGQ